MEIERRLSDVLVEFARTLVTDFPIQAILDHLVVRIVDVLPISSAGVTLVSRSAGPHHVAASDEAALRFEQIQTALGEGPCIAAYETGQALAIPDLRTEVRFPRFTLRAVEQGLAAVFTFPLRHGDHQLGALDLYRGTTGAMNRAAMATAQTLADVAAAYLLNAQARTDLLESSERALQISLHDTLTGLPNRALLMQRLQHAISRCRRSGRKVAILFADLDQFKSINDTHGHDIGDELLVAVAARLSGVLRPGDTVARLAGDEFVILCEDLDDTSQVELITARIDLALTEAFVLSGVEARVSCSVGIAFAGRGDEVPAQVLHEADTAMYQAKRKGGARHGIIDLREQRAASDQASLTRDLGDALTQGQLRATYQPIVTTADGYITAGEALLRWDHPIAGTIGPDVAIPLAERSDLIVDIGQWILARACLDRQHWHRRDDGRGPGIAVNVSARHLTRPGFVTTVADTLDKSDTEPALLTLEITESVFINDSERAFAVLHDLKRLGVVLALDDFGTGYSSLSYLKRFPVDIVKIDRSFVTDLDREPTATVIVGAIVGLAHGLGMTVIAEGIETPDQLHRIAELGCDAYQGFHFARPASSAAFGLMVAENDCTNSRALLSAHAGRSHPRCESVAR